MKVKPILILLLACLPVIIVSCRDSVPPVNFASEPWLFRTWNLEKKETKCGDNTTITNYGGNDTRKLTLLISRTFVYTINSDTVENGAFSAFGNSISFSPEFFKNNASDRYDLTYTGVNLVLETDEFLDASNFLTCSTRLVFSKD